MPYKLEIPSHLFSYFIALLYSPYLNSIEPWKRNKTMTVFFQMQWINFCIILELKELIRSTIQYYLTMKKNSSFIIFKISLKTKIISILLTFFFLWNNFVWIKKQFFFLISLIMGWKHFDTRKVILILILILIRLWSSIKGTA